ncbi:hypothetical protein FF100_21330 [Methylobacterium terricola]|uniref:Uncharacterized protein n=1 Tax=Methylobacterium terricola TaxID=2583531 RepID=A0A5C4LDT6_9HYPH|nr:hypothetical protein [Methylobacterium terricola]TNC10706.1 hypothetical protein FF100_21330 [Methylobacterium terricola]
MSRHEKFDTESSVVVGRDGGLSAEKPRKIDCAVRGTKIAALNLGAMSIGELAALLSVYEQAGRAFSQNMLWPELGNHGGCRTDDEAERCASIQNALLDELARRASASRCDRVDATPATEVPDDKGRR